MGFRAGFLLPFYGQNAQLRVVDYSNKWMRRFGVVKFFWAKCLL